MRKFIILLFLVALLLVPACTKQGRESANAEQQAAVAEDLNAGDPGNIPASVAGSFYPADANALKEEIKGCLNAAEVPKIDGTIVAAIVPHAGYIYSAPVAAYAYKAIAANLKQHASSEKASVEAVFILAFNHRLSNPGVSVCPKGSMETPLGKKTVAEDVARQFMSTSDAFAFERALFLGEHSAEVQVPFLQSVLPDIPIVPVIFGRQNLQNIEAVSHGLDTVSNSHQIVVVATTDLSHYHPYEEAKELDKETLDVILTGNPHRAAVFLSEHPDRMCGIAPVLSVLSYAESRKATPILLKYANSGDTTGQKDAVVGYGALVFVQKAGDVDTSQIRPAADFSKELDSDYLTKEDKEILLKIARRSLESYVQEKKVFSPPLPKSERLRENGAAFVTLTENGQLRGCIGHIEAVTPLYQTIAQMAVAAGTQDPRFPPVRPEELESIHIEISVNTPLRQVAGPEEIVLGKHGVVVSKGLRQGVFLPQVATETGWTKEEFLRNLCVHKAGLPADAYLNGARLAVFTSIVFEEEK